MLTVNRQLRSTRKELLLTLPSLLWLGVFFLVPALLVFTIAFRPDLPGGGVGEGWTLDTWARLMQPSYPAIIWRTLWVSAVATAACLMLAIPVAYWLARQPAHSRKWWLLLIILPFWTNFLIRIFAWKTVLHPDGFLKNLLVSLGLADVNTQLLYNSGAVLLVTIYSFLPFAILPLYAAAEKFDFQLLDAARDLGASRWQAFSKVFVPGIYGGILTAFLVTFIPALGSYAIPDIVGGPHSELIGNKIAQRVFTDRNLPHAAGISAVLALAVMLPLALYWLIRRRKAD